MKEEKASQFQYHSEEFSREGERAVTVFLFSEDDRGREEIKIRELDALIRSSGGQVIAVFQQYAESANPGTYIGRGKVEEIADFVLSEDIDLVVFDGQLTGSQMKNLSESISVKIVDRIDLILDIFVLRARTSRSILQVKLAQLEYRLPRLKGLGGQLSREGGGIGTRGPGEQKLETDRRAIEREIDSIKARLSKIRGQEEMTARRRRASQLPLVCLVGYTNVGKSSIMNRFLQFFADMPSEKKRVYADDRYFATLEISSRRIRPPGENPYLLADTIGFIRDLPDKLRVSFESTLEEIRHADLLILVVDSGNEDYEQQIRTITDQVNRIASGTPILYVMNKSDRARPPLVTPKEDSLRLSIFDEDSLRELNDRICRHFYGEKKIRSVFVPYSRPEIYYRCRDAGLVVGLDYGEKGIDLELSLREKDFIDLCRQLEAGEGNR